MVKNVRNYEMLEMQVNWLKDACECQTRVSTHPFVWVHETKEHVDFFQIAMYHIKKFILYLLQSLWECINQSKCSIHKMWCNKR
jgi:hypothetical protein